MAAMRAPTPNAALRGSLRVLDGRKTPASSREEAAIELSAHNDEALAFCDRIRPLVDRLHMVAVEIGPVAAQTVNALSAHIDRYERRHLPDDGGRAA